MCFAEIPVSNGARSENGVPIDDGMLCPSATNAQIAGKWANFVRISEDSSANAAQALCSTAHRNGVIRRKTAQCGGLTSGIRSKEAGFRQGHDGCIDRPLDVTFSEQGGRSEEYPLTSM
jgi:hypothetical protein